MKGFSTSKDLIDLTIKVATLLLALYAFTWVQRPLSSLQRDVAQQTYRESIEIQFDYPRLKQVNYCPDPEIASWYAAPTRKAEQVYQAQFTLLNSPNDFKVETYIFKRIVSGKSANLFPQPTREVKFRSSEGDAPPFGSEGNRPKIYIVDMTLPNQDPTTIVVTVMDAKKQILDSKYYSITKATGGQ